jgi:hypothetical protein
METLERGQGEVNRSCPMPQSPIPQPPLATKTWDVFDVDGNWMGTHLHGNDIREGLAGFLAAIDPDHVEEVAARIGRIERVDE